MENVIVAFESDKSCWRIRETLENTGTAACIVCKSGAEVKRVVSKQRISTVICGYKFSDESAEELFDDLPRGCAMLLVAVQSRLDLVGSDGIFKLAAPVSKGDLIASVRMLLQGRQLEKPDKPPRPRSGEEQAIIERAKALLMARNGMGEGQAHRFLQKKSMDSGVKLVQAAQMILDG